MDTTTFARPKRARTARAPRIEQLTFFPRGGKRAGAGRKPTGERALVSHAKREKMSWHTPAHVTMRLIAGLPTLRAPTPFAVLKAAFAGTTGRFDFQIVHFSVQSNHMHLIVEARDERALGRAMKGLGGRMTKALKKLWNVDGPIFADRFHSEVLRSPRQVRHNLLYVLNNHRKHGLHTIGYCDPYSSGDLFDGWIDAPCKQMDWADFGEHPPCSRPRSYLLRKGWRRHRPLDLHEVPGR